MDIAHVLARTEFVVFVELVFRYLNPTTPFSRAWYIEAMASALMDVADGSERRLQITVPPRHLKSIMVSVAYPAWLLGRKPETRIICASYGQDFAAILSRSFRKVIQSDWYAQIFPETASSIIRDTEVDVGTRQGGYRFATAVGGTVTGIGADLIIIDDLMKAQDAASAELRAKAQRFVDEALMTRLDKKKTGAVIAIQQRLHEDDVSAHLSAKGAYRHLNLPAIAVTDEIIPLSRGRTHVRRIGDILNPEREPLEVLEELRRDIGTRGFEAQYQQNPSPQEGDYIRWEKVQFYETPPPRERLEKVVHSWDLASSCEPKAAYSVGSVWGFDGASWLLLDVVRARLTYPDLLDRVRAERSKWQADVILVENASVGHALVPQLMKDFRGEGERRHHAVQCRPYAIKPRLGKADRFYASVEPLYTGACKLPRSAPWLDVLRQEMLTFPASTYDDQVDSVSQFIAWSQGRRVDALLNPGSRREPRRRD